VRVSPELARWLLASDEPSVHAWALVAVGGREPEELTVRRVRARIGKEGWCATLLANQLPEGQWDSPGTTLAQLYRPKYTSLNWRLLVLTELGAPARLPGVARAWELLLRAADAGARDAIDGAESEVCFTGNLARMGYRLGAGGDRRVQRAIDWLLGAQKKDGGWNCFPSTRGTLDGWEALAAFAAVPEPARSTEMQTAIERGAEFYLRRGLLHEGSGRYEPWYRTHYPHHYFYDFLVGLDLLTSLGYGKDRRLREALDLLESKRNPGGGWDLDALQPDLPTISPFVAELVRRNPVYPLVLEFPGRPSRWVTLTAIEVLRRAGRLERAT
jgi:hypothetical protein